MEDLISYILDGLLVLVAVIFCFALNRLYVALTRKPVADNQENPKIIRYFRPTHRHFKTLAVGSENSVRLQKWQQAIDAHLGKHYFSQHSKDSVALEQLAFLLLTSEKSAIRVQPIVPVKRAVIHDVEYEKTFDEASALLQRFRLNSNNGFAESTV